MDPHTPGFSLCMIDYYFNIKSKSKSGAPFNFWPHSFKFHLMDTKLIYRSILKYDNSINTEVFPLINNPLKRLRQHRLGPNVGFYGALQISLGK